MIRFTQLYFCPVPLLGPAMSFIVAYNLIRKKGKDRLEKIKELSNRKDGCKRGKRQTLRQIADILGCSLQRASKLRAQLLVQRWEYSRETLDALELTKKWAQTEIEEIDEMTENENILQFKQKRANESR